jgi:hypothetical protein
MDGIWTEKSLWVVDRHCRYNRYMQLVPPTLTVIQDLVRKAKTDPIAEARLRRLIRGAADRAPVQDVVEIGKTLLDLYRSYIHEVAKSN